MPLERIERKVNDRSLMPEWHCYCCHDTGLVQELDALPGGEDYPLTDPPVPCNRSYCGAYKRLYTGKAVHQAGGFNDCLTPEECEGIHLLVRGDWEEQCSNPQAFRDLQRQQARKLQGQIRSLGSLFAMHGTRNLNAKDLQDVEANLRF